MKKIIIFLLFIFPVVVIALQKPRSLSTDARIKVVAYQPDNVINIKGSNFINTQIIFGKQEAIVNYQSGDSAAWTANVNQYLRNILNIKPTILGSDTNLDVITVDSTNCRRYYRFHLYSEAHQTSTDQPTYAIRFIYPNSRHNFYKNKKQFNFYKNHKKLNWDYSFNGSRQIMPIHVFDDGYFTYFQFRDHQKLPAIFSIDNPEGAEAVVNYRRQGNYMIAHSLAPQWTLRLGRYHTASIFNQKLIKNLQE